MKTRCTNRYTKRPYGYYSKKFRKRQGFLIDGADFLAGGAVSDSEVARAKRLDGVVTDVSLILVAFVILIRENFGGGGVRSIVI